MKTLEDEIIDGLSCYELNCPHGVYPTCQMYNKDCPYALEKAFIEENEMVDSIFGEKDNDDVDIEVEFGDFEEVDWECCEKCIAKQRVVGIVGKVEATNIKIMDDYFVVSYNNNGEDRTIVCDKKTEFCKLKK